MDDHIEAADQAVEAAAAIRTSLRRKVGAEDRDELLREAVGALDRAREPLRRHLLRAPKGVAYKFAPEVRAATEAITEERERIQRMRYRDRRRANRPTPRQPRPRVKVTRLRGTVHQAKGVLAEIEGLLPAMQKLAERPLQRSAAFDLADDAAQLRDKARAARLRIADAQRQFKNSQVFASHPRNTDKLDADAEAVKRGLLRCEQRAARIARVTSGPVRRAHRWTREEAIQALDSWARASGGRWPTARELPQYSSLPSRGTLGSLGVSLVRDAPENRGST